MDIIIRPQLLAGTVSAIPSKSQAHRLLICAAFADRPTSLICPETNRDIEATAGCLSALGANICRTDFGYTVSPITALPQRAMLDCRESGSTLRFLLPVVGALGIDAVFHMSGRLPCRPLSPLWEEMTRMGCCLSRPEAQLLRCCGKLSAGTYTIAGNVSSQFITGLLYAICLLDGESRIGIAGELESAPYVTMTQNALAMFGVDCSDFHSGGKQAFRSPGSIEVEGDWSNAAFWLAANTLGSQIHVTGLNENSSQGDRIVRTYLSALNENAVIDARNTPDLVPVLAVVAGAGKGARFINCGRLRMKETDRLQTTADMIRSLGGCADIQGDTLIVSGTGYIGGIVDATNDHRIAMSAAVAATVCKEAVTIHNAQEVQKSYPAFWQDYETLGGIL